MGAGRLSHASDLSDPVASALRAALQAAGLGADAQLVVALSGGRDSAALLAALGPIHPRLRAIHVNHQLGPQAAPLEAAARQLCRQSGVALKVCPVEVNADARARLGLEAAARQARRAALIAATASEEILLTAHHADDQLETVLLKLLRGDGPLAGLGIRADTRAGGRRWLRPLLTLPRNKLADFAQKHALPWAEDPSNADLALDRNWLRHRILPDLLQRRPALRATVGAGAARSAELLDWIDTDVQRALARCQGLDPATLSLAALAAEPAALHAAIWTAFCRAHHLPPPRRADREALEAQRAARPDAAVRLLWPGAELRLWGGLAWLMPPLPPLPADWEGQFDASGRVELPDGRTLIAEATRARIGQSVRYARPGDRLRYGTQSLKFTELCLRERVPPWLRLRIPVLPATDGELRVAVGLAHDPQDLAQCGRVRCVTLRPHPAAEFTDGQSARP
ncbi:MAG: tRNA lysidine(34) synthetase TilS [Xanthomonadales bacterium]|nr:tRNA lysidine(34) synthetase TilS [Xanthomonadales bacterium]